MNVEHLLYLSRIFTGYVQKHVYSIGNFHALINLYESSNESSPVSIIVENTFRPNVLSA